MSVLAGCGGSSLPLYLKAVSSPYPVVYTPTNFCKGFEVLLKEDMFTR